MTRTIQPAEATQMRRLAADERGNVGMLFALSLTSLIMLIGCAVDYARAIHASMKMANAVDAAALAAGKKLRDGSITVAQVQALAKSYFDENMKGSGNYAKVTTFLVDVDQAKSTVDIKLKSEMPTAFMRVAGIDKINLPQGATAVYKQQDIEVGVQLDITGSMSGQKIIDLKAATKDLVDILIPDSATTNKVRIALAPFAAGVNAGSYASGISGSAAPGNCVYERQSPSSDATDAGPFGLDRLKSRTHLPSANGCAAGSSIVPLTDNKTLLKNAADAMTAGGTTAGHLGTAFAWYLVSPSWSSIWPTSSRPANYGDTGTVKSVILMTDGEYNTVGGVMTGGIDSQNRAKALCDNIRAQRIIVYTVGFKVGGDPRAIDVLEKCAGTAGKFYKAENGDELRAAFRSIAQDINNLRLSK